MRKGILVEARSANELIAQPLLGGESGVGVRNTASPGGGGGPGQLPW